MTFTFKTGTGKIEIVSEYLLEFTTAEIKKLLAAATENREDVAGEMVSFINSELEGLREFPETNKTIIAKYERMLSAIEGKKTTKRESALKRIIKSCKYKGYIGMFENAGKYCVTDGYILVRLAESVNLPAAAKSFDTVKAIGDISFYPVKLDLPDVKELKSAVKLAKAGADNIGRVHVTHWHKGKPETIVYDFGYGLPMVNVNYLINFFEIFPDCQAFARPGSTISPVYFVSGNDDGIILPIRKTREWEEPTANTYEEICTVPVKASEPERTVTAENKEDVTEPENVHDLEDVKTGEIIDAGEPAANSTGEKRAAVPVQDNSIVSVYIPFLARLKLAENAKNREPALIKSTAIYAPGIPRKVHDLDYIGKDTSCARSVDYGIIFEYQTARPAGTDICYHGIPTCKKPRSDIIERVDIVHRNSDFAYTQRKRPFLARSKQDGQGYHHYIATPLNVAKRVDFGTINTS